MRKVRIFLRLAGGVFLLFVLLWLLANGIIAFKKESINQIVVTEIKKQIKGNVTIGDVAPDIFRTFPNISIRLSNVSITDSLWNIHRHDFLKAGKLYVRLQFFSLLTGKAEIGKVIVEDCSIYLYTDENGYSNLNRIKDVSIDQGEGKIPEFVFKNTRITIQNEIVNSYHDLEVQSLRCDIIQRDSLLELKMDIHVLVHSIGFNMEKGSFLKEKMMEGKFSLFYQPGINLELSDVNLRIEKHPYKLNGNIYFNSDPKAYDLMIESKNVIYHDGVDLLTQALQQKLDSFDILEPFDVDATVAGQMAYRIIPTITTHFKVNDAAMETALGHFDHCTYSGSFSNHIDTFFSPGDANSKFIFSDVHAEWSGIQVTSTRMEISNLLKPFLHCDLQSSFDLSHLNGLIQSSTIHFIKGIGHLDIDYHASLLPGDTINPAINGTFSLNDASFHYIPRNLLLDNCTAIFEFNKQDLIISMFLTTVENTHLSMSGRVANLLALINISPEQLAIEWKISTPDLNLEDFVSYAAPKAVSIKKSSGKNKLISATENIDRLLSDGKVGINLTAGKMNYKKFTASDVNASIFMEGNKILLHDVSLHHAGGSVTMKGSLTNGYKENLVTLESRINNVDIPDLFQAFDDFGQDAITSKNMRGKLSAGIKVSGTLTDKVKVVENSMKGIVDFSVTNGELNNFEPAIKMAATAFKKRDFSQIRFSQLDNRLEINGSAISINDMEIRSNVVILFVEGVYDTKKGTDMSIRVPVSNLSRAEHDILDTTGRSGVFIRLRAKTQEDGKLKISWDPFNKAMKSRKEERKKNNL